MAGHRALFMSFKHCPPQSSMTDMSADCVTRVAASLFYWLIAASIVWFWRRRDYEGPHFVPLESALLAEDAA